MNTLPTIARLNTILAQEGVRLALAFLNGLTTHRFTALYRFDGDLLKNLYFYDRLNPEVESSEDIPILASYCVFVRDSGQRFVTTDALHDERVCCHPKKPLIQSYCGVPLIDEDGQMFGTICHFDYQSMPISKANVELMEAMAALLKRQDKIREYAFGH